MTKGKLPTAVFCGSMVGDFLPPQLIYQGKTSRCHPKYNFPLDWSITHAPKHWSTEATTIEYYITTGKDINELESVSISPIDRSLTVMKHVSAQWLVEAFN